MAKPVARDARARRRDRPRAAARCLRRWPARPSITCSIRWPPWSRARSASRPSRRSAMSSSSAAAQEASVSGHAASSPRPSTRRWPSGMCAHADETDDSHQPAFFHPGCAIVPAALADGRARARARGSHVLDAIVLGYEVGARVSFALGAMAFHQRGLSLAHLRRRLRRGRGGRPAGPPRPRALGLAAVASGAAGLGHLDLDARSRPRREGLRPRRHAGAQRA